MDKEPNGMGLKGLGLESVPDVSRGQVPLTGILQRRQSDGEDEVEIQPVENRSRYS